MFPVLLWVVDMETRENLAWEDREGGREKKKRGEEGGKNGEGGREKRKNVMYFMFGNCGCSK